MKRLPRLIDKAADAKEWFPFSISMVGPKISHLFFAVDLTLFARANAKVCSTIIHSLYSFNEFSRQKINLLKFKVIFSSNCKPDQVLNHYVNLSIQPSSSFGKYPSFSIFHKRPVTVIFNSSQTTCIQS